MFGAGDVMTRQKMIEVRTVRGRQQVSAWCIGEIAAHPLITVQGLCPDRWSVTHVPSGICFSPCFPGRSAAVAAAGEISALREDWATFDPATVTEEFKASLRTIYNRRGGVLGLPPADGDRRQKLAKQEYATDLNGYRPKTGDAA